MLAARPRLAKGDIYAASLLGDSAEVRRLLDEDRGRATARGGPYGWDALTHLCFSRYLRLRPSDGFVESAEALLDAGADPDGGFFDPEHQPAPTFESVLYGAAGVAHHAGVTRLLLERGADPNLGGEVAYHGAEGFDNEAMQAVVESDRLGDGALTTMLHRKLDWTDLQGLRWLLDHGADPNNVSAWGERALHHSLARDNTLPFIDALLEAGADPALGAARFRGANAVSIAARVGRDDALELFRQRGFTIRLGGDDAFFAALAFADRPAALTFLASEPRLVERLESDSPGTVATLAGAGNTAAVALALDLGFPLSADAIEVAVWRGRTECVRLLLTRGAEVSASLLALSERALTEISEWTPHPTAAILHLLRAQPGTARA